MTFTDILYGVCAIMCAAMLAYAMTPPVRVLAFLIGAVDVPTDERRMHYKPTPTVGGIAIFAAFALTVLILLNIPSVKTTATSPSMPQTA